MALKNYNQAEEDAKLKRTTKRIAATAIFSWELIGVIAAVGLHDWMQLVYCNIVFGVVVMVAIVFWMSGKVFK
jgi:hypothetical protein